METENEREILQHVTLFGNLLIGQRFEHDGQAYMKLAVDVGRRIYKDKPEIVHYQQFSNSTEVKKLN